MNDLMTKSFTSYRDLKKSAVRDLEEGGNEEEVEMAAARDKNLAQFLEEAGSVKGEMGVIGDILERLVKLNEESKSVHKAEDLTSVRGRVKADIETVLKKARWIRSKLEEMDRANGENRRRSALDRTRTSVTGGLRKKLKELMNEFQDLRQMAMAEHREIVGRRYFTVTGERAEEAVIEEMIASGRSESLLQKAIAEQGRGKVLATVHEIQDRHDAAVELERSLKELHQVFVDMAVMVETQGEQIDDIEHQVATAAHYAKDGAKDLRGAKKYQSSSRKWLCIGVVLLLLLVALVIVPITTTLASS